MPSVLVIDDDRTVVHLFRRLYQNTETTVLSAACAAEGREMAARHQPDVVMLDIMLPDESGLEAFQQIHAQDPRIPVIFITAVGASNTAIAAMKLGAFDYLLKPLDLAKVRDLVDQAIRIRHFVHVPVRMSDSGDNPAENEDTLVGRCSAMQEVYKAIGRVAAQSVTVLIRGESGTGKELVARAIYQHSPRDTGKFLAVNCAAIPETLLESELFGHEKGAFTGADAKRIGKFEQCSGGTLFLDEVGDMTPLMQSKVLRVLQEQRFERVGGSDTIETDVWIIAATNRDLEHMVAEGTFRADLYYRLNGFGIKLPPLRERIEDIPVLVEHFLGIYNRDLGKHVSDVSTDSLEMLMRYPWPGNVRELQSVLKQALLQAVGPVLLPEFFPPEVRNGRSSLHAPMMEDGLQYFVDEQLRRGTTELYANCVDYMERILLARVLRHAEGNQSRAAKILGITRGSLRGKLRALGITINQAVHLDDLADEESPRASSSSAALGD